MGWIAEKTQRSSGNIRGHKYDIRIRVPSGVSEEVLERQGLQDFLVFSDRCGADLSKRKAWVPCKRKKEPRLLPLLPVSQKIFRQAWKAVLPHVPPWLCKLYTMLAAYVDFFGRFVYNRGELYTYAGTTQNVRENGCADIVSAYGTLSLKGGWKTSPSHLYKARGLRRMG